MSAEVIKAKQKVVYFLHQASAHFAATKHGESVECQGVIVRLLPFSDDNMRDALAKYPGLIVVDYTHPDAVHRNSDFYCRNKTPFVMGTTGGDRQKLAADVQAAGVPAVIAPQMGKQLVAFQGAIEMLAEKFPGAFAGYTLTVREAHQSSKADTSGTAKAIVGSFKQLGCGDFAIEDIERVRDAPGQRAMGVPEEHLGGHAYHTYHLTSPDGMVNFEFQHNVCGRSVYAEGTVDAAVFLAGQIESGAKKTLFNMIDVLSAGAMN